jgi:hypothetical protein
MADHLVLRRLLWALTAIVLVVGLLAVPVVGDGDATATGSRRGEVTPSTVPGLQVDGGDGGVSTTAGDAGSDASPATTAATGGAPVETTAVTAVTAAPPATLPPTDPGLGAPVDPGPPVPPRVGLYRYRTSGATAEDSGDSESTTRVEERSRTASETQLLVTLTGGPLTVANDVVWRSDGVRTRRSTFTFGDRRGECDWNPDLVDAVHPLRPGATWTSDGSCAMSGLAPTPVPVRRTSTAEVLELRRVSVAGQVVDVWAIHRHETLTGAGMSAETDSVALFSPKHGLDVDVRGTASGQGASGEYRQELLNLDPSA